MFVRPGDEGVASCLGEHRDEVVMLYLEGKMSCREIGARYGVSGATVKNLLIVRGVPRKDPRSVDWPVAEMIRRYEFGETVEELGRWLGKSPKVVNKVLVKNHAKMRRRGPKSGSGHPEWKGGRIVDKRGYILVWKPDHPQANSGGYVREHRLVVEEILGRLLLPTDVVHHKNDDPADNRPENLQVFASNGDHLSETLTGRHRRANRLLSGCDDPASP